MTEFTGIVQSIIFSNEQDLFKIINVRIVGQLPNYDRPEINVTGSFGDLQAGDSYRFSGSLITHKKFGLQFKATSYSQILPHEKQSLVTYLSSDKFPGIGKKAAAKIVDTAGFDVLADLKAHPNRIADLPLSSRQQASLLAGISQMDTYAEIALQLAKFGINRKLANRLYQLYHGDVMNQIEKDPYEFVNQVAGYGFRRADQIGQDLKIASDDPRRIKGAVYQYLLDCLNEAGDTKVALKDLLIQSSQLLQLEVFAPIVAVINDLQHQGKLVVTDNDVALQNIYQTELDIAQTMAELAKRPVSKTDSYSNKAMQTAIKHAEHELGIHYDETQNLAICNALSHPISILTGGPGTGKTTIINGILHCLKELAEIPAASLESSDSPFLLAAPTGRAAKRMTELTGMNAKTIHRLLGIGIGNQQEQSDLNELNGEILIIDEMSMVDMFLFKRVVASIVGTRHVVFVGDKDQLPAVGAGNIFSDLIKSQAFPTTVLQHIHRQGDDSSIVSLAHAVNRGENSDTLFKKTQNYSFISCQGQLIDQAVVQITQLAIKRGFSPDDIQVLGAMYNGAGGITHLNQVLSPVLNPQTDTTKQLFVHDEVFRIGDRVLQLQNNPEKDIYNGQIGKIIGIDEQHPDKCLIANFDGRELNFSKQDVFDLTLAYAITIHKSQGSEFPLVILNLTMQNFVMLKRNLLYTAITRAQSNLVMVGEPRAFQVALATAGNDRKTGLVSKLQAAIGTTAAVSPSAVTTAKVGASVETETPETSNQLTPELIYSGQIDPMIGMAGLTLKHHA